MMIDGVIEAWIHLRNAYATFAPHILQKAREWVKVAYRIRVGEDVTFDEMKNTDAVRFPLVNERGSMNSPRFSHK